MRSRAVRGVWRDSGRRSVRGMFVEPQWIVTALLMVFLGVVALIVVLTYGGDDDEWLH